MYDVVILTDNRYENPKSIDWYVQQVLTEDNLLKTELEKLGLRVMKKAWNSLDFNWSETKFAVPKFNHVEGMPLAKSSDHIGVSLPYKA